MEETTFTNNAAEVTEAAAYAEAALAYTERTSNVRKVGVSLPVTDEQLADIPQIRGIINNRLTFMLRQRLDGQVVAGNGVAPNLMGLLNVAGVQTTAKAAGEPVFDAVYRSQRLVRITGRSMANGYVFHPTNWESQRLTRTTDGIYLLGNPNDAGPTRIWGLPVTEGDVITLNTGLCGAFSTMSELVFRKGIEVQVGYVNDDFIKGKSTLRADLRVAFPVYRAAGFCTITALP
jgi:HK97 family phage major capsid protein